MLIGRSCGNQTQVKGRRTWGTSNCHRHGENTDTFLCFSRSATAGHRLPWSSLEVGVMKEGSSSHPSLVLLGLFGKSFGWFPFFPRWLQRMSENDSFVVVDLCSDTTEQCSEQILLKTFDSTCACIWSEKLPELCITEWRTEDQPPSVVYARKKKPDDKWLRVLQVVVVISLICATAYIHSRSMNC